MTTLDQAHDPGATAPTPKEPQPTVRRSEIRVRGNTVPAPSVQIEERIVVTTGRWLRVASLRDEELIVGDSVKNPEPFISRLKASGLKADIFTFAQRLPDTAPKHAYQMEWYNLAVIPITTFSTWWKERIEYSIRKGVNRAKKLGVTVEVAEFNDDLLRAICNIYDETPVRQGRRFWHYHKDFDTVKHALATYLDRSIFIGAYHENALIGFMKLTYVGPTATITQILSARQHFDKRPNNALIAKAVEICELEGKSHFIYGNFVYYDSDSTLKEFKRRSGFEPLALPRYFVPLTIKGKVALSLGLHRGIVGNIPQPVLKLLLRMRSHWYRIKAKKP